MLQQTRSRFESSRYPWRFCVVCTWALMGVALLAGCGGGGGWVPTPPSVTGFRVSVGFNFHSGAALFRILGRTDATGAPATLTQTSALPAMACTGTGGAWFAGSVSGVARETPPLTLRWALETVSASTANLCLQMGYLYGLTGTAGTGCFRFNATGATHAFKSTQELRTSSLVRQHVCQ